ncbi:MAG: DUF1573 domain-containing protein [Candidatus Omnitrophica bacterium]|nr:DUF1573 domain-containing protein [Candidatus Omnitrophota bacterium]
MRAHFLKIIIFGFVLFLIFLSLTFAQEKNNQEEDPFLWDFGKIKEGEIVKHTFILNNDSDKILTISEVNTSCGCTVSQLEKKVINPGESINLEVSFNSRGYSGIVRQFIYVHTDSLDNPIIKYTIIAEVIRGGGS